MNAVLTYLTKNWQQLNLEKFGDPARLSSVLMTPRFKASSHLIFFVLHENQTRPILVVKVPRLQGDNSRLDKETENLRLLRTLTGGGFDSVPKVLAYEDYFGQRLLIETALQHETMRQAIVRKHPQVCIDAVLNWLLELQQASAQDRVVDSEVFSRLVKLPLDRFEWAFPLNKSEQQLLQQTREMADTLRDAKIPLVFEHGDLSSPNILMSEQNEIGVVDWELAETEGLPATDLFFFLTYVAFALKSARKPQQYVSAFHSAFWGEKAWTKPVIRKYCAALNISTKLLKPLFVLCWSRYVSGLVTRLLQQESSVKKLSNETADWLRSNRFYALWNHTMNHLKDLDFEDFG